MDLPKTRSSPVNVQTSHRESQLLKNGESANFVLLSYSFWLSLMVEEDESEEVRNCPKQEATAPAADQQEKTTTG